MITELKCDLEKRKLSRRDFLRYATLLGVSTSLAIKVGGITWPSNAFASEITLGDTIRIAAPVVKVKHPSQVRWISSGNQLRQVAEHLTYIDEYNITHPYLLEYWEVSEDLKTWTLNLRQGIKFNNGDQFTANDVVFTFNQWLNKDVGSSMLSLIGNYLDATGIEKTDEYQVKLHLKRPEIAVPEHLFHFPAMILNHRTFEGDFLKAPHGTGPYTLELYRERERCVVKRRNDYWQRDADGRPLPYVDGIEFIDMGSETAPRISAIKAGKIDMIDFGDSTVVDAFQTFKDDQNIIIKPATAASTRVLRMRVDLKPWSDNRVRMALKLCQNRERILKQVYSNQGILGQDFHVYPLHPEYCEKPVPKYDPQKAKQLLNEAGYPNGLDANLTVGSDWKDVVLYAEILKQDAAPAGFRINIQTMPVSRYWEKWTDVDLGITSWMVHRPLGTMMLNLAYTSDNSSKPLPWNETRWVDKEFSDLLTDANMTLDIDERRRIFCKLEEIQMTRGSIGIACWQKTWVVARKRVHALKGHPNLYLQLDKVWLDRSI
ncbi:MAG: ABC transporter substrate-binding protein [Deltaproteobacteria bacterium]|nr:ABC transporter substrate-binding protein [Deltaproteobacteria bacterium]